MESKFIESQALPKVSYKIETCSEKISFYNTDVFITLDGEDIPYYQYLHQIPDNLPDQSKIALWDKAVQATEFGLNYQARLHVKFETSEGELLTREEIIERYGELVEIPAWVVWIIIIGAVTGAFIGIFYAFRKAFIAPCGETGQERKIDECNKLIIAPDCHWVLYNSCKDEKIAEGGGFSIVNVIKYLTIGIVAVVAAFAIYKLIPHITKEKDEKA